ncbi:MAG: FAD-dependent oxidoreductase [Candidatus Woesearchaeota archaeon]
MENYDLIVVGAGPAGLNAAVYAARYKLNILVIGKITGGVMLGAIKICNWLGYIETSGMELTEKMAEQVKDAGVEIKNQKVVDVKKIEGGFLVKTDTEEYQSKKIILATGSERRKLNLDYEEELLGKGISYCPTCDAVFFSDQIVGVVGGGDAALTAALLISEYARKVYIFYRQDSFFRAEPAWVEAVEREEKIEIIFKVNVAELLGTDKLEGVKLDNGQEIELGGLFIQIGGMPNIELAVQLGVKLSGRYIEVDKEQKTSVPGVFAAGDITNNPLKQIITAAAEGAVAATSAYKEIKEEG